MRSSRIKSGRHSRQSFWTCLGSVVLRTRVKPAPPKIYCSKATFGGSSSTIRMLSPSKLGSATGRDRPVFMRDAPSRRRCAGGPDV